MTPPTRVWHWLFLAIGCISQINAQPVSQHLAAEIGSDGRPTGRLNHPVLFVHGISANASTWGAVFADQVCESPVVTFEDAELLGRRSQNLSPENFDVQLYNSGVRYSFRVLCRDGRIFRDQHTEDYVANVVAFASQAQQLFRGSLSRADNRLRIEFLGLTGSEEWIKDASEVALLWKDKNVKDSDWEGRNRDAELTDPRSRDLFQKYDVDPLNGKSSVPDYLARTFQLKTEYRHAAPQEGINDNGIYFYSAKKNLLSGCIDKVPVVDHAAVVGVITHRGMVQQGTYVYRVQPSLFFDGHVRCDGKDFAEPGFRKVVTIPGSVEYTSQVSALFYEVGGTSEAFIEGAPQIDPEAKTISGTYASRNASDQVSGTFAISFADAAAGIEIPTAKESVLDELASPMWTPPTALQPGQANQLYARMIEVLDKHYGKGNWENDPSAQIDLVLHSQGGLVAREMIQNFRDNTLANPVNHIRQIVTVDTPHFGSAFATSSRLVGGPSDEMRVDFGFREQPTLGRLRSRLIDGTEPLDLSTELTVNGSALWGAIPASKDLKLFLEGPLLGPYRVRISTDLVGDYSVDLYKNSHLDPTTELRTGLRQFAQDASYLAWPDESPWISAMARYAYPVYPGDDFKRIPMTTYSSSGVPNFVTGQINGILDALKAGCIEGNAYSEYVGGTFGTSYWVTCENFRKAIANLEISPSFLQLKADLLALDNQWSTNSDFVVDKSSQMGRRGLVPVWQPGQTNRDFHTEVFDNSSVTHWPVRMQLSMPSTSPSVGIRMPSLLHNYPAATRQRCEILRALGVTDEQITSPSVPACQEQPHVGPDASMLARRLSPVQSGRGRTAFKFINRSRRTIRGFRMDYPVVASSRNPPEVLAQNLSGASVQVVPQVAGRSMVRVSAPDVEIAPGAVFPDERGIELEFRNSDGESWGRIQELALPASDTANWTEAPLVVVRDGQDSLVQGRIMDSAWNRPQPAPDARNVLVVGRDERGTETNIARPVLRVKNQGAEMLKNIWIYYFFESEPGKTPVLATWSIPWNAPGSTVQMFPVGDRRWVVEVALLGLNLKQEETSPEIRFGLHYTDWSAWDASNDVSRLPDTIALASGMLVRTEPIGRVQAPVSDTARLHVLVTGRDEGFSEANHLKPRLVIKNLGADPIQNFRLRFQVVVDAGKVPVLESNWYTPKCIGRLEQGAERRWDAVFDCRDVQIPSGQTWPDASGMVFGLHHVDWSAWDKTDDPSAIGMGEILSELHHVGIEALP